jgi:hypothetical protein
MLLDSFNSSPLGAAVPAIVPHARQRADGPIATDERRGRRFLRELSAERLEELFQQTRAAGDYSNAAVYFELLAELRHRDLVARPNFDATRPSIITSFQPKSGGTFLHNRMVEIGFQEFWWGFPGNRCHSYVYTTPRTLELYMRGGAACHTHCRPEPALLSAFDRIGVEKVWVHLRNPIESAISAYYHYRGVGHGGGAAGDQRRRQALETARAFSFLTRSSISHFVRAVMAWMTTWVQQWLQFDQDHPGLVVLSYHKELADLPGMMGRVLGEFGMEPPASITCTPTDNDRFRQNRQKDWRDSLSSSTRRQMEELVRSSLGKYAAFERLWT